VFYAKDYRNFAQVGDDPYPTPFIRHIHTIRAARQYALLVPIIHQHKIYLDIGCALGWSVNVAKYIGFDAYGVEPADFDRQWAKENLALDLYESIEALPRRDFDLVVMSHVLEHIIDPIKYLAVLYNDYMVPGARLVIEVPSQATPSSWSAFHAVAFNTESLVHTLREAGFEVELIRSREVDQGCPPDLIWSVGKKPDDSIVDNHP
jgi:SAM-dependent methyltransferase